METNSGIKLSVLVFVLNLSQLQNFETLREKDGYFARAILVVACQHVCNSHCTKF